MDKNEHEGHRKRLDEKSNRLGFEFLEEHEQLEKLLFVPISRGNTNEIAHRLLDRFGSLSGVLTADINELCKVEGVGSRTAHYLHDLYAVKGCIERAELAKGEKNGAILRDCNAMGNYAKTLFYGKLHELSYMVSLNKKFQAYRIDMISQGSMDETPVYIQEVVRTALLNRAVYVMIAHNHPLGILNPSQADIDATNMLGRAFNAVGISLVDHIIVGGGEFISLKDMGII